MLSSSGPGGVDEVSVRKWVTLSVKEHIAKVQEAQTQLRTETAATLQDFSTKLTKLESAMEHTGSIIKRTQESCKYVNKELATLKELQKATAEHTAETLMKQVEEAIKTSREIAEKAVEQMTRTQQQMMDASAKASQELEALQQEMRGQKMSGALFSLRVAKLTDSRRTEMIRELEQQQASLPQHFDRISAENVQLQLPASSGSAAPGLAGQASLQPQPPASSGQSSSQLPAPFVEKQETGGDKETTARNGLDARLEKLEWKQELQQLAANIFCLRMMDTAHDVRANCLEKLELKHKDLSDVGQVESL